MTAVEVGCLRVTLSVHEAEEVAVALAAQVGSLAYRSGSRAITAGARAELLGRVAMLEGVAEALSVALDGGRL